MQAVKKMPERKHVTISSKRQFTIPQKFYTELGFQRDAICTMGDGILIIEPDRSANGHEFAEQILEELINEGFEGKRLLDEFKTRQSKVRPAGEELLAEAKAVAKGNGKYATYEDIFGAEE